MRYVWETQDFENEENSFAGSIVSVGGPNNVQFWMIGFRTLPDGTKRFCLINLRDGQICDPMSADEIASHSNGENMSPIYETPMVQGYIKSAREVLPLTM